MLFLYRCEGRDRADNSTCEGHRNQAEFYLMDLRAIVKTVRIQGEQTAIKINKSHKVALVFRRLADLCYSPRHLRFYHFYQPFPDLIRR